MGYNNITWIIQKYKTEEVEFKMHKPYKVTSITAYKKKKKKKLLTRVVYSTAKYLSITLVAVLLVWTISNLEHTVLKGNMESKVDQMQYSD